MATAAETFTGGPLVEPHTVGLTRAGKVRVDAIDMLRGLVIAIMVLDHVRDFFHVSANAFDPTDPSQSWPLLYLTRWVTHLCAPTFVLLSGVSIYLQKINGKTGVALGRFLVSRGLWLVFLECTVIMFAWNFGRPYWLLQVIWAIGWSMVAMALIAQLPSKAVLVIGIALVALSPIALIPFAPASDAATIADQLLFGTAPIAGLPVFIAYPIIPWLGVMAMGFGAGPLFAGTAAERRRQLLPIALGLIALFFVLRRMNSYGSIRPWLHLPDQGRTVMSFFDVSKYPPSPDYVCITLGLSLLVFLGIEHLRGPLARILRDFGRTPLFTYTAHLYIAHGLMLAAAIAIGRPQAALNLFDQIFSGREPPNWGWSLGVVYLVWLLVLAILVPLSRWFAGVKQRRRDWWLSYL
ncbi:MAG: heparan-alpha-glucosaminide N-acetyltransferase domain-containing protein [Sphingomicrobium sp.]